MKLKFSVVGVIAFLLLGACVYLWGPALAGTCAPRALCYCTLLFLGRVLWLYANKA